MAFDFTKFSSVLPNVVDVVKRFPLSVLISFGLTVYVIRTTMQARDSGFISIALVTLFLVSVGTSLLAERREWSASFGLVIIGIAIAVIGSLFLVGGEISLTVYMMPIAVLLAASSAAYLLSPQDNKSYWMFTHMFWISLLVALFGSLLISTLVSLLIAAFGALFGFKLDILYSWSFIICLLFVGPLFWLSMLPKSFTLQVKEGEPEEFTSKVTALFVKFVFVPFFFLFAVLLHGLAVKVLLDGHLPNGQIGWYGLFLIVGGIGTYLMAYPTRLVSGPLVKFFSTNWMWFLLVPLALVIAAYVLRVQTYGMTPVRYYLGGLFVWSGIIIVYAIYVKYFGGNAARDEEGHGEFDLRIIPVLAAILLFFSSFGPWGAEAGSVAWQKSRLVSQLEELGVLSDGVIVKKMEAVAPQTLGNKKNLAGSVRSSLRFFRKRERADVLLDLLSADAKAELAETIKSKGTRFEGSTTLAYAAVGRALGSYRYVKKKPANVKIGYFDITKPFQVSLPGKGLLLGPFGSTFEAASFHSKTENATDKKAILQLDNYFVRGIDPGRKIQLKLENGFLVIRENGDDLGRFPVSEILQLATDHLNKKLPASSILQEFKSEVGDAVLMISRLDYEVEKDGRSISSFNRIEYMLFFPQK